MYKINSPLYIGFDYQLNLISMCTVFWASWESRGQWFEYVLLINMYFAIRMPTDIDSTKCYTDTKNCQNSFIFWELCNLNQSHFDGANYDIQEIFEPELQSQNKVKLDRKVFVIDSTLDYAVSRNKIKVYTNKLNQVNKLKFEIWKIV